MCVNRIIAEPWRQCLAVSPVDIGESEDPLTEEELDLVQGYMDEPFHDWGSQREGKGQDKAWWEVDSIVSGSYDGNTFVKRVLDHMSSQDEPIGGNPPATVTCSEARPEMALWVTWEDHLSRNRVGSLPLK